MTLLCGRRILATTKVYLLDLFFPSILIRNGHLTCLSGQNELVQAGDLHVHMVCERDDHFGLTVTIATDGHAMHKHLTYSNILRS